MLAVAQRPVPTRASLLPARACGSRHGPTGASRRGRSGRSAARGSAGHGGGAPIRGRCSAANWIGMNATQYSTATARRGVCSAEWPSTTVPTRAAQPLPSTRADDDGRHMNAQDDHHRRSSPMTATYPCDVRHRRQSDGRLRGRRTCQTSPFRIRGGRHGRSPRRISWDPGHRHHEPQVPRRGLPFLWSRSSLRPTRHRPCRCSTTASRFNAIHWLEALGFCGIGEARTGSATVRASRSTGELPLNPHGGSSPRGALPRHGLPLTRPSPNSATRRANARSTRPTPPLSPPVAVHPLAC